MWNTDTMKFDNMLRKRSQGQKLTDYMIPLIWNVHKKQSHRESRLAAA